MQELAAQYKEHALVTLKGLLMFVWMSYIITKTDIKTCQI